MTSFLASFFISLAGDLNQNWFLTVKGTGKNTTVGNTSIQGYRHFWPSLTYIQALVLLQGPIKPRI